MNLELIIKLVKLANNNPNENEANQAARKVCQLIAAGKFKFNSNGNQLINQPRSANTYNPTVSYEKEPFDPFEFLRNYTKQYSSPFDRKSYDKETWGPEYVPFNYEPIKKKEKPKQKLYCMKCNKEYMTAFVGPPQMFKCNLCVWEEYMESKSK